MPVSRVSCRYPGPRESVHIKLLVSPVSFSHNNVRLLMVYSPYGKFAYRATVRLAADQSGRTTPCATMLLRLYCAYCAWPGPQWLVS